MKLKQFTNHVALVIDGSGSIQDYGLTEPMKKAVEAVIAGLRRTAEIHKQETRVSVYVFSGNSVNVLCFDMDVMRVDGIMSDYRPAGGTPMCQGIQQAIEDLRKVPALYTDHAFLVYILTDGEENTSSVRAQQWVRNTMHNTIPDNWTIVGQVPNVMGRRHLMDYGFAPGNIMIWDTTEEGLKKATETFTSSADTFMRNRATGVRGSSSYFNVDASNLNKETVKKALDRIKVSKYKLIQNPDPVAVEIKDLVEKSTGQPYVKGNSYYGLVKTETIQPQKQILVREKSTGYVYAGEDARVLLGLNFNNNIMVRPTLSPSFDVFVQSTSVNRRIIPKQSVITLV